MTKRRTIALGLAIACGMLLTGYRWRKSTIEYYRAMEVERREQWIASTIADLQQGNANVHLYSCANTDLMLEALKGMPEVASIIFEQAFDLSEKGLSLLASLPNLTYLEFRGQPQLNDTSLPIITRCDRVETLAIKLCKVTDTGLPAITSMPRLAVLKHSGQFSAQALAELGEAMPSLLIEHASWYN